MQKVLSWRELLKDIISNLAERERIATEIGVNPVTLLRWASGETKPRPQNLRQLVTALPQQYCDQFLALLGQDGLLLEPPQEDDSPPELPLSLVKEVLGTRANSPDILRYWAITRQVLQHALRQLDPGSVGMAITLVHCMPPTPDGKIHSLRESVGLGSAPWEGDLELKALFLGAESLVGHVSIVGRFEQIGDLRTQSSYLPAYQTAYEVSAAACPIKYAGRVAGCLLFSCTQPEYFLSEARHALIQSYTDLVALAFEPEEFYAPELLELRVMPPLEAQRLYFLGFRQRVARIMRDTAYTGQPLNIMQAEQVAWRQIEEILLQLPSKVK